MAERERWRESWKPVCVKAKGVRSTRVEKKLKNETREAEEDGTKKSKVQPVNLSWANPKADKTRIGSTVFNGDALNHNSTQFVNSPKDGKQILPKGSQGLI